ncbi:hypothetical protein DAPPUDRAFT_238265 [Daphnia pulex]|uniref:Uncharacterized protein n=1 Tax=Daphnia pulex TaxID=6669 RepID=E9G5Z2_DAPPU|nr:hypothetical protein DAPPUDRAFT_238265 [Daphnia pulex]|eukprot:EFX84848.1 hypothetical protein DAPPUDRAFT_238265 [Daphnia pulex]
MLHFETLRRLQETGGATWSSSGRRLSLPQAVCGEFQAPELWCGRAESCARLKLNA